MIRIRHLLRSPQLSFRLGPPLSRESKHRNVRGVKFQRPWIRNIFATFFLYGTAFHLWSSFVLVPFEDVPDDVDESDEPASPGDEDPIHIPLSWPRKREGEFYAASDPEWQEFVKVSKDKRRIQSLKNELATIVLNDASRSSLLSHVLGQPLSITGFWLLHHFPFRAPPEYNRLGLEISEAGIDLVSKRMSSEDGDRLRRFMQPLYVALAIKDAYLVFFKRQVVRFWSASLAESQAAGTSNLPPSNKHVFTPDAGNLDSLGSIFQSDSQLPLSNGHREGLSCDSGNFDHHPSSIISSVQRLPLPKFGPGSDLYLALLAFKWRLNEYWTRASHTPRRGTFYVTGPVGLKGPKGVCRVEVRGEYDPVSSSWTAVRMQLKDLNFFKQRPYGGP